MNSSLEGMYACVVGGEKNGIYGHIIEVIGGGDYVLLMRKGERRFPQEGDDAFDIVGIRYLHVFAEEKNLMAMVSLYWPDSK